MFPGIRISLNLNYVSSLSAVAPPNITHALYHWCGKSTGRRIVGKNIHMLPTRGARAREPGATGRGLSQVNGLACQEVLGCNATALAAEYGITGALAPREEVYGFKLPGFDLKHCGGTTVPAYFLRAPAHVSPMASEALNFLAEPIISAAARPERSLKIFCADWLDTLTYPSLLPDQNKVLKYFALTGSDISVAGKPTANVEAQSFGQRSPGRYGRSTGSSWVFYAKTR
ncbi:hypothetical protein K438DRAFT_1781871 [Mycena galopus ATCC 62051]|nr:hypothetical protein K438DRAFT_1781871 [Mycena galopus ATCC 62051]